MPAPRTWDGNVSTCVTVVNMRGLEGGPTGRCQERQGGARVGDIADPRRRIPLTPADKISRKHPDNITYAQGRCIDVHSTRTRRG